jgi:hypothetical protein
VLIAALIALVGVAATTASASAAAAPSKAAEIALARHVAMAVFSSSNPRTAYDHLSASDKKLFDELERPVTTHVTVVCNSAALISPTDVVLQGPATRPSASGCWIGTATGWDTDVYGIRLFTYWVEGTWCYSGTTVTSDVYDTGGGQPNFVGWNYDGVLAHGAGVLGNTSRTWDQTKFVLSELGYNIQEVDPCIRLIGAWNGSTSSDFKCTIS